MLIAYTAGKYRADSEWELVENIRLAEYWAARCWKIGLAVICPHKNTAHFGNCMGIEDQVWLDGDLEIIKRCDILIVLPNWATSSGTKAEIELAKELFMPIFYVPEDFKSLSKYVKRHEALKENRLITL